MIITGIRVELCQFKLNRKYGDANIVEGIDDACGIAVFLDTDEGLTGVSIGSPGVHYGAPQAIRFFEPLLLGEDPRGVRALWKKMTDAVFKSGVGGADKYAISYLDCALWDLKAKINGEPLWKTLGASQPRVHCYASGIDTPLTDEELRNYYEEMAKLGVSLGKLKVGLNQTDDLRRLGIMQEALAKSGKKPRLAVDANEYWSVKQAVRSVREFEESFDLLWCEEPVGRWDYRGLKKVSKSVKAAVATGENLTRAGEYLPLIENGGADIVQIGQFTLGITGALQVAELASAFDLPVAMMSCPGSFMAHLAAALPNHLSMEVFRAGEDFFVTSDLKIEDGYIILGNSPGVGITVDEQILSEHKMLEEISYKRSNPGRGRGAGLLGAQ